MALEICTAQPLNPFVRYYEPLSYQPVNVTGKARCKRSASREHRDTHSVEFTFRAHKREFRLRLARDRSSFSDDFVLVTRRGATDADLDHIYSGYVVGADNSRVIGAVIDGVFTGRIVLSTDEEFYVERATRFLAVSKPGPFHSVIYSARDVTMGNSAFCGVEDLGQTDTHANLHQHREASSKATGRHRLKRSLRTSAQQLSTESDVTRGSVTHKWPSANRPKLLQKRTALSAGVAERRRGLPYQPLKRVCHLQINVDHLLFEAVLQDVEGDVVRAYDTVTAMVASHAASASEIFGATNFLGITGISFAVQHVQINDSSACEGQRQRTNPFCWENLDAIHLLAKLSLSDYSAYCASYLWTHRNFPGGLLGVAYMAEGGGYPGGICEPYQRTGEGEGGMRRSAFASLNTGIITFQNHNGRVPQRVTEITFAHELGHNFGSPHDFPAECVPGGTDGNYVMFANAQTGSAPNNRKFSPCSVANISIVLDEMFTGEGTRPNCFQEPTAPFCGNMIREETEECDCGDDNCLDRCCYPRKHPKRCTLRAGAKCSPTNGACCSENCAIHNTTQPCRPEDECQYATFCDGMNSECPPSAWKPDGTLCNRGTQLCEAGECQHSVCRQYNLNQCFLTGPGRTPEQMCLIACQEDRE
ncbi:disintegrin and metalloproteinase domain-containing protein 10-like [Dermacentor andersoni]|uniref:disintegrin and metalloproteinase domain-containing protein 10-like n=1 Tax=Dermacentor andersoni TaxID=34620 RepID=UPI0024171E36|nr:disintegrin and metalloproteinase domain-containing protein 10-like [Dermacentor andersoni]